MKNLYLTNTKKFKQYVLAESLDEAKSITEEYFEKRDYGFSSERKVIDIKVIAQPVDYPDGFTDYGSQDIERLLPMEDVE